MKLIILDFDGTMGDSEPLITRTMLKTIDELHLEHRTREQCAAMIGLPLKQTFTDLIPMSDEMGDECAETYTRIFFENNVEGAVPPFPHVIETIQELHRRGLTITIASSRRRPSLEGYVREYHLEDYISYIVSASEVEHAKPHPEPGLKTLQALGVKPEDTLVVGDTTFDILMGQRAGAHTCGVTYGNGTREQMIDCHAGYLIDDFAELLNLV